VGLISAALVAVPFLTSRNNLLSSLYRHKSKITWLVVGVLILYLVGVTKPITNRIAAVGSDILWRQGSIYLRVEEFGQALRAFEDRNTWRKLIGTGANTTTYFLQSYADAELNAKMAPDERLWWKNMVRNQYLQYLLDGGIITLVSFLGVFFFIYIKMFTVKNLKITELSFWVLALVFFVSGLVYYHTLLQKILFWGALGVVGSGFGDFEFEIKTRVVGLFFVLFGVFSLLFAILFGTSDFLANSGKLAQASRLVPWYDAPYRRMANVHLYRALGNKSEMDVNLGIKYATKAYSLNPWDINNINAMRAAYYRAGVVINKDYHQEAFKYAREYLAKNPAQAFGWDYLGLIYLDLGQLPEAREAFVKAVTLDPDYRGAYLHIGETFKQEGDFEQAEKYYLMAITKWPRWDFAREEMESLRELRGSDQTYD
jgi:tetratricopeptide (TPR) repeat protein